MMSLIATGWSQWGHKPPTARRFGLERAQLLRQRVDLLAELVGG
jgi:hypothetical protein